MTDVIVIGAGPAGVIAALRAADLGARTTLVTRAEFGGMAANDGQVPVRFARSRGPADPRCSTVESNTASSSSEANVGLPTPACARA